MGNISITMIILFLTQFILFSSSHQENVQKPEDPIKGKETLGIIIGGVPFPFPFPYHFSPPPECNDCFTPPPAPEPVPEPAPEPEPEPECPPPPPLPHCPPPASPPPPQQSPPPPPPPPPPPKKSPPPPPPKPSPPPPKPSPPPENPAISAELRSAIKTIQNFKKLITYDPTNVTGSWVGNKICVDPSAYKGFFCAKIPGDDKNKIAGITFNGLNLNSKTKLALDGFINGFNNLVFYHANSNNFTGIVPLNISKLVYFYELDLSNNKLKGAFPEAVLGAKNLTFIDLRYNFLTGSLPSQVFDMDLDVLFLNNNQFTGKIPDNLGNTPALYLTLANNQFTGPIPKSIGQAKDTLVEVLFLGNQLSGCLPHEIGLLKVASVFDASYNKLTGPIPHSFGCLTRMEILNLGSNQLYGPVPESLCKLTKLYTLSLQENYFTQVGPECRKLIKKKVLNVGKNCILDLPDQKSAAQCAAFFSKRRNCPDQRSMSYVPCDISDSATEEKFSGERLSAPGPSPSYAALEKPGS